MVVGAAVTRMCCLLPKQVSCHVVIHMLITYWIGLDYWMCNDKGRHWNSM